MTRKALIDGLLSKGIVVTNPLFENEDLAFLNTEVGKILDKCEEEEVDVSNLELNGKKEGDTEVIHVLYPGSEQYLALIEWLERIKKGYQPFHVKYVSELNAFVFFKGDPDEATRIANNLANEILKG